MLFEFAVILKNAQQILNFFLSFNEDRALRGMIRNVIFDSFESIFYALSKTLKSIFIKTKGKEVWHLDEDQLFGLFQDAVFRSLGVIRQNLI